MSRSLCTDAGRSPAPPPHNGVSGRFRVGVSGVTAAAKAAMTACFGLCGNRDVEPVLPKLISAAVRPKEVPECVHSLAATTFVQSVDAPTLAVVVPLLSRALGERGAGATALKRQAALIICNMSKLVDDARDAAPFLPKLLPGLVKLADEMSDPEAREVCERSVELMKRLEAKCSGLAKGAEVETKVAEAFNGKVGAAAGDAAVAKAYVLDVCNALAARRGFAGAEWAKAAKAVSWCLPGGEASPKYRELTRQRSRPRAQHAHENATVSIIPRL